MQTPNRENSSPHDTTRPGIEDCGKIYKARCRTGGWPNIEVSDTDKEVKVTAELPGLEEKDIDVELANGILSIKGEKKTETEDKDRLFSECYYGRFERRIPVDEVEEDKVSASFKNGVLTVTLPKSAKAQENVKRIMINPQ